MLHTARVDPDEHRASALGNGITQIRLPMRGNPLRYVNAYAVEEREGLSLIDCGWKTDDVFEALTEGLAMIGASLADVRRLFVTHFHSDHYGLAGTVRRAGVAALRMHAGDWEAVLWLLRDPVAAERASDEWLARNGYAVESEGDDDAHHWRTELAEPTALLDDGAVSGRLEVVWTPGHSPGHLCFRDGVTGSLFSGDHILDPITPHVGIWTDHRGDPLGDYRASLGKVARLGTARVLPAHGEPFADLQRRVDELGAHIEVRERQVLGALAHGPQSAADIARALAWTRSAREFDRLEPLQQQFAVAETLAYLEYSRARGLASRDETTTPIQYAP